MNLPKTKSTLFISASLLLVIIIIAIIIVPGSSWKNIFNVNKSATVFVPNSGWSSSSSGMWESTSTWNSDTNYPDINDDATINVGTITLNQNQNVHNLTLAASGTLDLGSSTLNVSGDWNNTGGTLLSEGGTVNLVSPTTQSILGTNTFENLTKIATASSTLIFDATATTTITGNLTLTGLSGSLLSLLSSASTIHYQSSLGSAGSGDGQFYSDYGYASPRGIAIDNNGNVYVADASGNRVEKFDSSGNYISQFGSVDPSPNNWANSYYPSFQQGYSAVVEGVAVNSAGDKIYTTDWNGDSVHEYDNTGASTTSWGGFGPNTNPYGKVAGGSTGIGIDSDGNVYVLHASIPRVEKFDSSGNYISQFGSFTTTGGEGQFDSFHCVGTGPACGSLDYIKTGPFGLAIDRNSNDVYVVDQYNNRVEKFDSSGNYLLQFGTTGSGDGEFNSPTYIAVDNNSRNVYITDTGNNRIQKFNSSGNYISQFGSAGSGAGQLSSPHGIAIDPRTGNIFVADTGNSRVEVFAPASSFNILKVGSGITSLSYLGVLASKNMTVNPFVCTGCQDNGFNTNWSFVDAIVRHRSRFVLPPPPGYEPYSTSGSAPEVTSTIIPTEIIAHVDSINKDLIVAPNQSGTYVKDTNIGQIILDISSSTIQATTTFSIIAGAPATSSAILIATGTQLTNGVSYNINAVDSSGSPVHSFASPLTITLPVSTSSFSDIQDLGVYWLNETTLQWVQIPNVTFANNQAIFQVDHLTEFAILESEKETVATTTPKTVATTTSSQKKQTIAAKNIATTTVVEQSSNLSTTTATSTEMAVATTTEAATTTQLSVSDAITNSVKQTYEQTAIAVQQSIQQTVVVAQASVQATNEAVNSPTGAVVTKVVSTTGVVVGAGASVGAAAFASPITLAEIWLIPAKMFGLLAGALGIRRKNRKWGTVYDSVTKRPLDPVYVSLINMETNKEVSSALTDIDGRYGFLVVPGKYRMEARKTNYITPSTIMKGKSFDEVYNDLYFGEEIIVADEGETITKNIPMDPVSFDWNEFTKAKTNVNIFMKGKDIFLAKVSEVLFATGAVVAVVAAIFAPAPYNFIVVGLYVLAYIFSYIEFKSKKAGTIKEKNTNIPLSFAIVKIFREGEGEPLVKKIADKFGDYYALVPNGRYYLIVDKKNDDESYSEILHTANIDIKNGIINFDLIL